MDQEITENEQMRKLFLGGLSFSTTEDDIKDTFKKYGTIVDCVVIRAAPNHQDPDQLPPSRGFGFVTYSSSIQADALLELRQNTKITMNGRDVDIKRAMSREATATDPLVNEQVKKVYIGGIGDLKESDLKGYFEQYGTIDEVIIPKRPNDPSRARGFAFIAFSNSDIVDKIVTIKMHKINGKEFEVKKAAPQTNDRRNQRGGGFGGGRGGGRDYDNSYGGDRDRRGNDSGYGGGYGGGGGGYGGGGGGYGGGGGRSGGYGGGDRSGGYGSSSGGYGSSYGGSGGGRSSSGGGGYGGGGGGGYNDDYGSSRDDSYGGGGSYSKDYSGGGGGSGYSRDSGYSGGGSNFSDDYGSQGSNYGPVRGGGRSYGGGGGGSGGGGSGGPYGGGYGSGGYSRSSGGGGGGGGGGGRRY